MTAPSGRDTISTTEARQRREKGWHNMTATLYITRTDDMIRTGKPAEVTLDEYAPRRYALGTWTRRLFCGADMRTRI